MRIIAAFTTLLLLISLILTLLSIFAGDSPGSLESYDLLTLNTSRIGVNAFGELFEAQPATIPTSGDTGILGWLQNLTSSVTNVTNAIGAAIGDELESELGGAINNTLDSIARDLGLYDFYSFHIKSFCEGYYNPNGSSHKDVYRCTPTDGLQPVNITQLLENQLEQATGFNITLAQINWPQNVTDTYDQARMAFKAAYVIYILIAVLICLSIVSIIPVFFKWYKFTVYWTNAPLWLAAILSLVVSAVITSGVSQAVDQSNTQGAQLGINASKGTGFLGLTWAAMALLWLACLSWIPVNLAWSRRQKKIPKSLQ